MPRCCSIFIQSERARRACPRALTSPARWIAPPNSSSFSVSVVLPASGCEMIAKVRRELAGLRSCASLVPSRLREGPGVGQCLRCCAARPYAAPLTPPASGRGITSVLRRPATGSPAASRARTVTSIRKPRLATRPTQSRPLRTLAATLRSASPARELDAEHRAAGAHSSHDAPSVAAKRRPRTRARSAIASPRLGADELAPGVAARPASPCRNGSVIEPSTSRRHRSSRLRGREPSAIQRDVRVRDVAPAGHRGRRRRQGSSLAMPAPARVDRAWTSGLRPCSARCVVERPASPVAADGQAAPAPARRWPRRTRGGPGDIGVAHRIIRCLQPDTDASCPCVLDQALRSSFSRVRQPASRKARVDHRRRVAQRSRCPPAAVFSVLRHHGRRC